MTALLSKFASTCRKEQQQCVEQRLAEARGMHMLKSSSGSRPRTNPISRDTKQKAPPPAYKRLHPPRTHLSDADAVPHDAPPHQLLPLQPVGHLQPLAPRLRRHQLDGSFHGVAQLQRGTFQHQGVVVYLGEVEDVSQDEQKCVAALQDCVCQFPLLGGQRAGQQQLQRRGQGSGSRADIEWLGFEAGTLIQLPA